MANPGARDEVVMLYKIFLEQSDGKTLIIRRNMDFLLAFGAIYFVTNLSPFCQGAVQEQGT
jgi:hypothetical protein